MFKVSFQQNAGYSGYVKYETMEVEAKDRNNAIVEAIRLMLLLKKSFYHKEYEFDSKRVYEMKKDGLQTIVMAEIGL
jgi:hypothetical protein